MDELKARIRQYWCQRSRDFTRLRQAELESGLRALWENELQLALPAKRGLKILDVGTGSGFFVILLAGMGHQVTGIDLSAEMINEAEMLSRKEETPAVFRVMDAEQPDFPDAAFDVVVSRNLTWTLEQPEEAYRQWLRVLKNGGLLVNFDADYGKEQVSADSGTRPEDHAHRKISQELLAECDAISRRLFLSRQDRPDWDRNSLERLGAGEIQVDTGVSRRVYREINELYNPTQLFRITAVKRRGSA